MDTFISSENIKNQQKSEQNIKQQLSVLKGISESIKSPVFSVDKDFKYTSFNKAHTTVMKLLYNANIELYNNMLDYMTVEEDREKAKLNLTKALNSENLIEESFSGEQELTRLYFEVTHNPIYNDDNTIIGVAVMAKDITVGKRAEEKLQTSETLYRRLFESAKDGILILDALSGQIVDANPFLTEMLGYSREELIGKELWEIGVFKNIAESKDAFIELQNKEYIRFEDMPLQTKDGKPIDVEFISNVYLIDCKKVIQCNIRNITERKHAEEKLQISENSYRRLFESAKDGILILDALSGQIVDVNPFITELLGYNHQELLGKELWEIGVFKNIVASKDGFIELQTNEYIRFEDMPLETKGGKQINVEFISNVYLVDHKKVIQCNIRDITERKRAEEQLLIAKGKAEESDRLKTAFLHNVSHEIRTPMNAIVGFSGFLNEPDLLPEKRKHFTDIIIQSSEQLLSIITDIISIASIEAGQEKIQENEININLICKLINEQFFPKSPNKNVTLSLKTILADDEAIIITDATKLTQIITNLIGNALKFTQQGYVNFGYTVKDSQLEFYVEDSGIGIPLDMQDAIFNRFRQVETNDSRKFGGSGLGLSISKAYAEMLGGKMWLTSELNKGSVFYFTIPYKKVNLKKLPDIPSIKGLRFEFKTPKTILIAEDEDSNFMLLEELLSDMGINIIRAVNGLEAVELCKSNPHINLVLMDIKMPEMDGYEATIQIKKFKPDLYIIAQTAYSTEADKNKAFACGCSDFMSKPLKRELLLSKINEQLLN